MIMAKSDDNNMDVCFASCLTGPFEWVASVKVV